MVDTRLEERFRWAWQVHLKEPIGVMLGGELMVLKDVLREMGGCPPKISSCSSSSQMAASNGKAVQQPPALAVIIFTHSFSASSRFS